MAETIPAAAPDPRQDQQRGKWPGELHDGQQDMGQQNAGRPIRIGLFVTCLIDLIRPEIGLSVVDLLEAAGCEVVVPAEQTCCGQPGYNSGDVAAACDLAEKFLREFERFDAVVIPSGSCAGMIVRHYLDVFRDDPDMKRRAAELAGRVYELTDFLARIVRIETVPGKFQGHFTYHDSCSGLHELGVAAQPRALLAKIPGATLCEMRDCTQCCGFGGAFALKYGAISAAIVDEKIANIRASGADAVVMGDLGCMLQIEGRLRRTGDHRTRVLHIAQVLAGDA